MEVRISAAFSCSEESGSEGRAEAKRAGEMGLAELDMVRFLGGVFGDSVEMFYGWEVRSSFDGNIGRIYDGVKNAVWTYG